MDVVEDDTGHVRSLGGAELQVEGGLACRVPDDEGELGGRAAPAVNVGIAILLDELEVHVEDEHALGVESDLQVHWHAGNL